MPSSPDRGDFPFDRLQQDISIQKNDGVQRLPLSGSRYLFPARKVAEECFDFLLSHLAEVPFGAVKPNVPYDPVAVAAFCPVGIMVISKDLSYLIHQF